MCTDGTEQTQRYTVCLYVRNDDGENQVVERPCESSEEAFDEAQTLLDGVDDDPHISEGDYCYVQVDRYAGTDTERGDSHE